MSNEHDQETGAAPAAHPELSQPYRAHSTETPGAELDARIRAAAHRAAGSRPQAHPHRWFRWIDAPLATAAVVLISVTVAMMLREQGDPNLQRVLRKETVSEVATPAPVAAPPQASRPEAAAGMQDTPAAAPPAEVGKPSPAERSAVSTEESKDDFTRRVAPQAAQPEPLSKRDRRLESDATPVPVPVTREQRADEEGGVRALNVPGPAPAAPAVEAELKQEKMPEAFPAPKTGDTNAREMEAAETSGGAIGERAALERKKAVESEPAADSASAAERDAAALVRTKPAPAPAPAAGAATPAIGESQSLSKGSEAAQATPPRTPEQWLTDIRRLVRDGKLAEARIELAEFRKSHPTYPLPEDLKDL